MALDFRALFRTATRFHQVFIGQSKRKGDTGNLGQRADMVPLTIRGASGQTADLLDLTDINGVVLASFDAAGVLSQPDTSRIGSFGVRCAHAKYVFGTDGGAVGAIVPALTAAIPAKAIIIGGTINSPTAVTSGGAATVAVGLSAGAAANSLLTATAIASLGANALVNSNATLAAPVKTTAAGNIQITVATAALTAGVIEVFVYYTVAQG